MGASDGAIMRYIIGAENSYVDIFFSLLDNPLGACGRSKPFILKG